MVSIHPADQTLAHPLGHGDDQPRGILGGLSGCQYDFGYTSAQEPTEVEAGPPSKLFELDLSQLGDGLLLGQLPGEQAPHDIPHSPARTSRIRCQCVPAQ